MQYIEVYLSDILTYSLGDDIIEKNLLIVRKLKLLIDSMQVLRKGSYSGRDLVLGQLNRKCFSSSMTLHI